jgi:hypothetical protein
MIRSIRGDGPYLNYSLPIAENTLTAIMVRESAYSGQEITWDQINSQLDVPAGTARLRTADSSQAPTVPAAKGLISAR